MLPLSTLYTMATGALLLARPWSHPRKQYTQQE